MRIFVAAMVKKISGKVLSFLKEVQNDSMRAIWLLFKIMIPVSIIVKILQEIGAVEVIGEALSPLMQLVGLPGEMGLVWATGMITNLFGGILAFIQLSQGMDLSIAQVTVISAMLLVAHTFPIELQIARKAGVRIPASFVLRFIGAFLLGLLLNLYYNGFDIMTGEAQIVWKPEMVNDPTLMQWAVGELKNYAVIIALIIGLIVMVKLLRELGIIKLITKGLGPLLRLMGIGEGVTTISIIGLTLGIVYGGAIMITESKSKEVFRRDIFYSMALMGLCHSLIEDTLLVVSLGADIIGVLVIRFIFSVAVVWMIVKLASRLSDRVFYRYLMIPEKTSEN